MQQGLSLLDRYLRIQEHPKAKDLQKVATSWPLCCNRSRQHAVPKLNRYQLERQIAVLRQEACFKLAMLHTEELTNEERTAISNWGRTEFGPRIREVMPPNIAQDSLERILTLVIYFAPQRGMMVLPDQDCLANHSSNHLALLPATLFEGVAHETKRWSWQRGFSKPATNVKC